MSSSGRMHRKGVSQVCYFLSCVLSIEGNTICDKYSIILMGNILCLQRNMQEYLLFSYLFTLLLSQFDLILVTRGWRDPQIHAPEKRGVGKREKVGKWAWMKENSCSEIRKKKNTLVSEHCIGMWNSKIQYVWNWS